MPTTYIVIYEKNTEQQIEIEAENINDCDKQANDNCPEGFKIKDYFTKQTFEDQHKEYYNINNQSVNQQS